MPDQLTKADIFDWDVPTWSEALPFWADYLPTGSGLKALELAANKGGLSLYLASLGFDVTCSDVVEPAKRASRLHERFNGTFHFHYEEVDALAMKFSDNTFDLVIFKSFLGYLSNENQQVAMNEIYRVLKPGGVLLFAENLSGSLLHRWARRSFVPWGRNWNYVTAVDCKRLTSNFKAFHFRSAGFLSLFAVNQTLKHVFYPVDRLLGKCISDRFKYVLFGAAIK